jgi:hypothetical protein
MHDHNVDRFYFFAMQTYNISLITPNLKSKGLYMNQYLFLKGLKLKYKTAHGRIPMDGLTENIF